MVRMYQALGEDEVGWRVHACHTIVSARRFAGVAAVSVRDVRLLESQRTNVAESIGLGLFLAAGTFGIFYLIAGAQWDLYAGVR
jgi:hypothetical protein